MNLPIKIGIGSGVTLIVISIFGWGIFPAILKHAIQKNIVLKPGGEIREMWTKVPFPVDFKVYIFNVTNARDVTDNGDSPVLDEIGPFFFDEWKEKLNLEENDINDTIAYNTKTRFVFNKEKSGKLTMDEIITIPHPMMTGMLLAVARDKPSMMTLVSKALKEIFDDPESIFITSSVRNILFDGLVINCTVSSFGAKAVCSNIKAQSDGLDKLGEKDYLFSFFGTKNKTLEGRLEVQRGLKNSADVGRVVAWNNKTKMNVWSTAACNQYHGTDSTIFPSFLKKEQGLWSFAPDLCRSLGAYYVKDTEYLGLPVWLYKADLGDMSSRHEDKCFCPTPTTCLKKGVMDLFKCTGAPIIVSLPHFFNGDQSYIDGVRGLRPNEDEHGIFLLFEHMTGTPVSARKRLQFNLPLQKIPKVSFMANLPETVLPIMWVEEGLSLGPEIVKQIDKKLFRTMKIMNYIKWIIISLSLVGLCVALALHFYKKKSLTVSTVTPAFKLATGIAHLNGTKEEERKQNSIISTIQNKTQDANQKY